MKIMKSVLIGLGFALAALPAAAADSTGASSGLANPGYQPPAGLNLGSPVPGAPAHTTCNGRVLYPSAIGVDANNKLAAIYEATQNSTAFTCHGFFTTTVKWKSEERRVGKECVRTCK